jgi:putative two-component system response regulator
MKPGPLDREEWVQVRQHTIWGERILGTTSGFAMARRIARSHHENWDGSGYPDGLIGEGIPLAARIVHIADVFDALYHRRPYKPAWELDQCIDELLNGREHSYDPELVTEFIRLLERHPELTVRDRRLALPGSVA